MLFLKACSSLYIVSNITCYIYDLAIPATVYNKKYNFIFIFFPTYLPNLKKKKSVNQLIKLEWPNVEYITLGSKWISTNFPNRLLLLFLTVLAFPKASSKGLAEIK